MAHGMRRDLEPKIITYRTDLKNILRDVVELNNYAMFSALCDVKRVAIPKAYYHDLLISEKKAVSVAGIQLNNIEIKLYIGKIELVSM